MLLYCPVLLSLYSTHIFVSTSFLKLSLMTQVPVNRPPANNGSESCAPRLLGECEEQHSDFALLINSAEAHTSQHPHAFLGTLGDTVGLHKWF
jgi:hypothetical protein